MKIATWNVTTLRNYYRVDILTDELRRFGLDLLEASESHIPGVGSMKLSNIKFVYSDRKDGEH